jgi:hypothetical protein
LQDLPADLLKAATLQCLSEAGRAFAPSVGEIRGAAVEIQRRIAGLPTSYQAWQEVLSQMAENGGDFGNPEWSHPLIEATVKTLGWRNLRMSDNQVADRANFVRAYDQLSARTMSDDTMLPQVRDYIVSQGGALPAPKPYQLVTGKEGRK